MMNTPHPQWEHEISLWLATLRGAADRESTLKLRHYQLRRLAAAVAPLSPWAVTSEQLLMWVGSQLSWRSRDTRRSYHSALRGFYGWGFKTGRVAVDPSTALPKVRAEEPNPRPAPEIAYREALARADGRTALMLELAADLGLRRGEVAAVHGDDLIRVGDGWALIVHGKGGKIRRVPVPAGLAAEIRRVAIANAGYLFPGAVDGHLSAAWVGRLVTRRLPGVWATHSLRHRFGTAAYEHERDIAVVQELMGHASLNTTRRYVLVPSEALRRTVEAVRRR